MLRWSGRRVLADVEGDGLLMAVHHAFADHRPLALTPDAIWLTIAHGVAQHVRKHALTLRARLVRRDAPPVLEIESSRFAADDPASIAELLAGFRSALANEVAAELAFLPGCDFTTSTDVERIASDILLLDLYAPYVSYRAGVVCGIPEITVEGTPADWRAIRSRIDALDQLDLGFWTRHLKPIADQFVCAAEGQPDRTFFQRIYKPQEAYGEDLITGWVGWMYPYLGPYAERPNPLLQHSIDAPLSGQRDEQGEWQGPHITPQQVPTILGTCDVEVRDHATGESRPLYFEAGVGAVEVLDGGALRPAAVWWAREGRSPRAALLASNAHLHALIDRIIAKYPTTPGRPPVGSFGWPLPPTDPMTILYTRLGSAAMGDVQLLPYEDDSNVSVENLIKCRGQIELAEVGWLAPVFAVADGCILARTSGGWARTDGSCITRAQREDGPGNFYLDRPRSNQPLATIPIVARELEEILAWILEPTRELPVLEMMQSREHLHGA